MPPHSSITPERDSTLWNVIRQRSLLTQEPNEVRILRIVRDRGPISRIEIATATGLHKATITDLVAKLIDSGLLEDTGEVQARNKVGRKRLLLRFLPLAGIVAGVDIRMTHATVALTDLNARLLLQESFDYAIGDPVEKVLSLAASKIKDLLKAGDYPRSKLVGIGVGVQGIIDYSTNTLVVSYNKKSWQGQSLSGALEREFNVPVYVENDVKTMALAEYLLGAAKGTKNFIHIWVGEGVGAGIVINGHLLHGITFSAGEIGYNLLEFSSFYKENFPLTYRNQAMFGEILTDANLVDSYRRGASLPSAKGWTVSAVAERARLGDPVAQGVIEEYASLLSILCIPMVNMLNPEMIVVGGRLAQSFPGIGEVLQHKIHRDLLAAPVEAVKVRAASHGELAVILGAAGLVLYELFEPLHGFPTRSSRRHSAMKSVGIDAA
jgi:predicted NBD/HSP70 family sugar kinase